MWRALSLSFLTLLLRHFFLLYIVLFFQASEALIGCSCSMSLLRPRDPHSWTSFLCSACWPILPCSSYSFRNAGRAGNVQAFTFNVTCFVSSPTSCWSLGKCWAYTKLLPSAKDAGKEGWEYARATHLLGCLSSREGRVERTNRNSGGQTSAQIWSLSCCPAERNTSDSE